MLKHITLALILHAALFSSVMAEDIRVKCDTLTMNVPSADVICYQITENSILEDTASDEELAAAQVSNIAIYIPLYESDTAVQPEITVYRAKDLENCSLRFVDILSETNDLVQSTYAEYLTPEEAAETLPFMPFQSKPKSFSKMAKMIRFENGAGIRAVVSFGDPVLSASGGNLYYTMQGTALDGEYYVAAVIPLKSEVLNNRSVSDIDWNSITETDFDPSLSLLDDFMGSIVIDNTGEIE